MPGGVASLNAHVRGAIVGAIGASSSPQLARAASGHEGNVYQVLAKRPKPTIYWLHRPTRSVLPTLHPRILESQAALRIPSAATCHRQPPPPTARHRTQTTWRVLRRSPSSKSNQRWCPHPSVGGCRSSKPSSTRVPSQCSRRALSKWTPERLRWGI